MTVSKSARVEPPPDHVTFRLEGCTEAQGDQHAIR